MNKTRIAKIIFAILLLGLFSAFSLYIITVLFEVTGNPVGAILTIVAYDITGFGFGLVYVGNKEDNETSILWKNE